jgi:hypothetical protein
MSRTVHSDRKSCASSSSLVAQEERDARAVLGFLGGLDRVLPLTLRSPAPSVARAGTPGLDDDLTRDHEARVEADAELADQLRRVLGLLRVQPREELFRSRARDRAQIRLELGAVHTDPVVGHRERARLRVDLDPDLRARAGRRELGAGQRFEPQLVERVARVRDELPKEDLAVLVERVDDEAEELLDLGLEAQGLDLGLHGGPEVNGRL